MVRLNFASMRSYSVMLHGVGFAAAAAILAAVGVAHRTAQARLADMHADQQHAESLLQQVADIHQEHARLQQELARDQDELASLHAFYPGTLNETDVLERISGLCEQAGLALKDFHPGAIANLATHKEFEVRFHCDGPYSGVCRFLAGLNELPCGYRITQLNLAAPAAAGQDCGLDLQLRLSFALKEAPAR